MKAMAWVRCVIAVIFCAGAVVQMIPLTLAAELSQVALSQQANTDRDAVAEKILSPSIVKPFQFNDPVFSPAVILKGLWFPQQFVHDVGYGLYGDDARKKNQPILVLVHGFNDSPRRWQSLIPQLQVEHYRVLRFYYPSGMSIETTAGVLAQQLQQLAQQSPESDIVVIGHSMGGLVSRAAIQSLDARGFASIVKAFMSVATPWGGHPLATLGVQNAPILIPVIRDLAMNSPFLQKLYVTPWPSTVPFYLLYASTGSLDILGEPNDGVVTLRSQMDERIARDAEHVVDIPAAHVAALTDKQAITLMNRVLFAVAAEDR